MVFSIRLALSSSEEGSPSPDSFSSFSRTKASTGVASSNSLGEGTSEPLGIVSSVFSWVDVGFVTKGLGELTGSAIFSVGVGRSTVGFSLGAIIAVASTAFSSFNSCPLSDVVVSLISSDRSDLLLDSVTRSVFSFSRSTLASSTTETVCICSSELTVSAATIGPTRVSPMRTDATPTAYFRIEKRCLR